MRSMGAGHSLGIVKRGQEIQFTRSQSSVNVVSCEQSRQVVSVGLVPVNREQVKIAVILFSGDTIRQGGNFISDLAE